MNKLSRFGGGSLGALHAVALAAYGALSIIPIGFIILDALRIFPLSGGLFPRGFGHYSLKVTANTLLLASFVVSVSLVLSIPAAWVLASLPQKWRRLWMAGMTIPLASPTIVSAIVVRGFFDRSATFSQILRVIGMSLPSAYGFWGVLATQLIYAIPFTTLIFMFAFSSLPRSSYEQAQALGASPWRVFSTVIFPSMHRYTMTAMIVIVLFSLGDLGGPLLIGGGFTLLSSEIYVNYISNWGNAQVPFMFGMWAVVILGVVMVAIAELERIRPSAAEVPLHAVLQPLRIKHIKLGAAYLLMLSFLLLIPFISEFFSLGRDTSWSLIAPLFSSYQATDVSPIISTLSIAVLTIAIEIPIAILLAHVIRDRSLSLGARTALLYPTLFPGVVAGFGFLGFVNASIFHSLGYMVNLVALALALAWKLIPLSFLLFQSTFDKNVFLQEQSAISMGASPMKAFFSVAFPQALFFLPAAIIMSFYFVATDLSTTLVLVPPGWKTMAVHIAYYFEEGLSPKAIGMSLILLVIIEILLLTGISTTNIQKNRFLTAPLALFGRLKWFTWFDNAERRERKKRRLLGTLMAAVIQRTKSRRQIERQLVDLQHRLSAAELKMLRSQINPHFLFNALNTIVFLIQSDSEAAISAVGKLSAMFRYVLDSSEVLSLPLTHEIEYLKNYLEIEKIRFKDSLNYAIRVQPEAYEYKIQPMLLQPLIENAVRYGKDAFTRVYINVDVTLAQRNGMSGLVIQISDYGVNDTDLDMITKQPGVGIRNVMKRMENLRGAQLEFKKRKPHGLNVILFLPHVGKEG